MKILQLVFKYTQNEYVQAERQYLLLNKTIRKYDPILVALFMLLSLSYILLSSFSIFSIILLGIVLIATALGSYLYFVKPVFKFKHAKKYQEEYIMIFSKDIIKWITPSINSELKWDIYSELWESNDFYYLIQVPHMYTLIPKRAFADQIDKQVFEEIARSNLKSIKRMV